VGRLALAPKSRWEKLSDWLPRLAGAKRPGLRIEKTSRTRLPTYSKRSTNYRISASDTANGIRLSYCRFRQGNSMTSFLKVQSPSDTTIEFKVSSKEPGRSGTVRFILHVVRTIALVLLLLFNVLKAQQSGLVDRSINDVFIPLLWLEPLFGGLAAIIDWRIFVPLNFAVFFLCLRRDYTGMRSLAIWAFRV
jgi:hypothetical protein